MAVPPCRQAAALHALGSWTSQPARPPLHGLSHSLLPFHTNPPHAPIVPWAMTVSREQVAGSTKVPSMVIRPSQGDW